MSREHEILQEATRAATAAGVSYEHRHAFLLEHFARRCARLEAERDEAKRNLAGGGPDARRDQPGNHDEPSSAATQSEAKRPDDPARQPTPERERVPTAAMTVEMILDDVLSECEPLAAGSEFDTASDFAVEKLAERLHAALARVALRDETIRLHERSDAIQQAEIERLRAGLREIAALEDYDLVGERYELVESVQLARRLLKEEK